MSIYKAMREAGVELDSHASDLYVPVNETTIRILQEHPNDRKAATTFVDNITHTPWFDIPFGYDPFWQNRPRQNVGLAERT